MAETLDLSKRIISGEASLAAMEMELSVQDTLTKPNIRSVFKDANGEIGFSVVKVLVHRFINSFAFSNKLGDVQIEMLTVDTLENFAYESLQDVVIFFKMARSGKFGNTNRSVDSNLVYGDWFPKYLAHKTELREQNYLREKGERVATPVSIEDVRKTYAENQGKVQHKAQQEKVKEYVEKITRTMDRQMLEDTIIDWEKDPKRKPFVRLLKAKRKIIK